MPELPEVESISRRFNKKIAQKTIVSFECSWPKHLQPTLEAFQKSVANKTITKLYRRGKYLVMKLQPHGFLTIHLRMSGRIETQLPPSKEQKHIRASWTFSDASQLYFIDSRKFGRLAYTEDLDKHLSHLGIEPLAKDFTLQWLAHNLKMKKRQMKPLLLDQSFIAGLGNIYTDEALYQANIHPLRICNTLTPKEVNQLHTSIISVLKTGIKHNGTSIDWIYPEGNMQSYLKVYGRTNQPCDRCKQPITYLKVGQRGTHVCTTCQKI